MWERGCGLPGGRLGCSAAASRLGLIGLHGKAQKKELTWWKLRVSPGARGAQSSASCSSTVLPRVLQVGGH